jgi:hypothetical protein
MPADPARGGKVIRTVSFLGPVESLIMQENVRGKNCGKRPDLSLANLGNNRFSLS